MSKFGESAGANPLDAARRLAGPARQRRFYDLVEMVPEPNGLTLRLDGKRPLTPARKPLTVPPGRLADAIAGEWLAQREHIDPATMPATRLANSVIDGVSERPEEVRDSVFAYAGTDLVLYRAIEPEGLVERQRAAWDPIVAWAEKRFGRLVLAGGMAHVAQPPDTLAAIGKEIEAIGDPFRLAGLSLATTLTGSALLALALANGAVGVKEAWSAGHVDEDWNISQWGEDAEAKQRRARRFDDFAAAALVLAPSA
jgi:chaperone required for assembly of F1-ATPase